MVRQGVKSTWRDDYGKICGAGMCTVFPTLNEMARSKGAKVAELWVDYGEGGSWNFRFVRPFNDWELGMAQDF